MSISLLDNENLFNEMSTYTHNIFDEYCDNNIFYDMCNIITNNINESNHISYDIKINNKIINNNKILEFLRTDKIKSATSSAFGFSSEIFDRILSSLFNCSIERALKTSEIFEGNIKFISNYKEKSIYFFIDINDKIIIKVFHNNFIYKTTFKINKLLNRIDNIILEGSMLSINKKEILKLYFNHNLKNKDDIRSKPILYCFKDDILSIQFKQFIREMRDYFNCVGINKRRECLNEIIKEAIVRFRNKKPIFHHNFKTIRNGLEEKIIALLDKIICKSILNIDDFIYQSDKDLFILTIENDDTDVDDDYFDYSNLYKVNIHFIENENIYNFKKYIKSIIEKFNLNFNTINDINKYIQYYFEYVKFFKNYSYNQGLVLYENYKEELNIWMRLSFMYINQ